MSTQAEEAYAQTMSNVEAVRSISDKLFDIVDEGESLHLVIPAFTLVLAAIGIQLLRDDDYPQEEYLEDIYDSIRAAYDNGLERLKK